MANEQRFYRHVENLDDAKTAIRELTDHSYDLREQMDEMRAQHKSAIDGVQVQMKKLGSALNSQINGLNVKGVPPANGQTLKWNASTGQIEWT